MIQHFERSTGASLNAHQIDPVETKMLLVFVGCLEPKSIQTLEAMSPTFVSGAQIYLSKGCSGCYKVNGAG